MGIWILHSHIYQSQMGSSCKESNIIPILSESLHRVVLSTVFFRYFSPIGYCKATSLRSSYRVSHPNVSLFWHSQRIYSSIWLSAPLCRHSSPEYYAQPACLPSICWMNSSCHTPSTLFSVEIEWARHLQDRNRRSPNKISITLKRARSTVEGRSRVRGLRSLGWSRMRYRRPSRKRERRAHRTWGHLPYWQSQSPEVRVMWNAKIDHPLSWFHQCSSL